MKRTVLLQLVLVLFIGFSVKLQAESDSVSTTIPKRLTQPPQRTDIVRYKLYPTENMWNFIKLDTRTGKMWIVQYGLEAGKRFEWVLSDKNLASFAAQDFWTMARYLEAVNDGEIYLIEEGGVEEGGEVNGRFTLYPTQNIWNFILLDQITGQAYQVQWSLDPDEVAVLSILEGTPAGTDEEEESQDDVYGL